MSVLVAVSKMKTIMVNKAIAMVIPASRGRRRRGAGRMTSSGQQRSCHSRLLGGQHHVLASSPPKGREECAVHRTAIDVPRVVRAVIWTTVDTRRNT